MTRRQRSELVAVRAELILADEPTVQAYMLHFEAQLHRAQVRRLLYVCYVHFARAGAILFGLNAGEIQ
jgi:hypothetical protein